MSTLRDAPAPMSPSAHVTSPAASSHPAVAETNVTPAGSSSVTSTCVAVAFLRS